MTADGPEAFGNRRKQQSAWPAPFAMLSFGRKARLRSKSCLIASFMPDVYDSDHFDSFLRPTIDGMLKLERGTMTTYADGQMRKMRGYALLLTGRNAMWPCRKLAAHMVDACAAFRVASCLHLGKQGGSEVAERSGASAGGVRCGKAQKAC